MSQKYFQIFRSKISDLRSENVDYLKSHREKKFFLIFLQSIHQVDMKNVVKCYKDFFGYFNALKTHSERGIIFVTVYRDTAIVKFESGPWCSLLQKCISFYLVAYYRQRSLQFEIPHFQILSWPSEAIKILFANFNLLITAKSLLVLNMRIIQNFVSWG